MSTEAALREQQRTNNLTRSRDPAVVRLIVGRAIPPIGTLFTPKEFSHELARVGGLAVKTAKPVNKAAP